MPRPFRKSIGNFSGGVVKFMSPKDIKVSLFQEFLNVIAFNIG